MKIVGIIAEYNPFHLGHEYQIRYAKEVLGADFVVVAMSGDFVQRGTPALLEKHVRTKMALSGGADLVLELPVMWATASAEAFARGGVELLHGLGVVDELCFGCECGTAEDFLFAAKLLRNEPARYREALRAALKKGSSYPEARALAFRRYLEEQDLSSEKTERLCALLNSPNNILGIEYCKALIRLSSSIRPAPLLRKGDPYHAKDLSAATLPSARALRQLICSKLRGFDGHGHPEQAEPSVPTRTVLPDSQELHNWMNPQTVRILEDNLHRCLSDNSLDEPLFYALLTASYRGELLAYPDMTPELANRIRHTLPRYQSFPQFVSLLKTKEITQTHIQRALLHVYLGLTQLPEEVPCARILGFRKASGELLRQIRQKSSLPLLSKPADAARILDEKAYAVFQNDVFCSGLYESLLLFGQPAAQRHFVHEFQKQLVII